MTKYLTMQRKFPVLIDFLVSIRLVYKRVFFLSQYFDTINIHESNANVLFYSNRSQSISRSSRTRLTVHKNVGTARLES